MKRNRDIPIGVEVIRNRAGHSHCIGYARVSTTDQKLDSQIDALKAAGCCRIYSEKVSGAAKHRPAFEQMKQDVRKGDIVVVTALDRLSRKTSELLLTIDAFRENGVHTRELKHGLNTQGPQGKMLMHIVAVFAETERDMASERTRNGLSAAARRGRFAGRPLLLTPAKHEQIAHLHAKNYSLRQIARTVHLGTTTVRRALEMQESEAPNQLELGSR